MGLLILESEEKNNNFDVYYNFFNLMNTTKKEVMIEKDGKEEVVEVFVLQNRSKEDTKIGFNILLSFVFISLIYLGWKNDMFSFNRSIFDLILLFICFSLFVHFSFTQINQKLKSKIITEITEGISEKHFPYQKKYLENNFVKLKIRNMSRYKLQKSKLNVSFKVDNKTISIPLTEKDFYIFVVNKTNENKYQAYLDIKSFRIE